MSNNDNSPLKILLIASGDLWAGAEVQIYYLAQALNLEKNINLQVVLMNDFTLAKKLRLLGIKTTVFDEAKLSGIQVLHQLIRLTREFRPSIIHTHRQKENIFGSISSLFVKNCHCVRTQHGDEEHPPSIYQIHKIIYRFLDRFCGKYIQKKIISVSDELTTRLSHIYPPKKIITVYNGINIEEIQLRANESQALLPGNKSALKIGIFARLVPVKCINIFIEIAEILQQKSPEKYNFYIFGDGPLNAQILHLIESKKLTNTVFMMGHQENVYPHIKIMNFVLITSSHEGLPMNLLEAMCLRTPVVAHAVGGIPDALEHGKSGILITQNMAGKYVEKIIDPETQQNLSKIIENAYQYCNDNYSSHKTCKKTLEIYSSLIA